VVAVVAAEFGQGLLSAFGIAQAHQDMHQQRPCPRNGVVRGGKPPGQRLGGLERGQRVGVPSARQLEQPAEVTDDVPGGGLGVGGEAAFGALDPGLGLVQSSLPRQYGSQHHVGGAGGRVAGPAVSFGQLDRLPAAFGRPRIRVEHFGRRQVRQAGELQKRPPNSVRERNAPLQVPLCLRELACPDLGGAEADQRQRAQVLAQGAPSRVRGHGQGLQPPGLLGHREQVATLADYQQPDDAGQQLYLSHRTVRNHLYRVFPKLGITSRAELAAAVGASPDPA
jgi:DNA-binding CsgD family transcriptional regulator